jgi:Leucine-rich repeat (LRR) protein
LESIDFLAKSTKLAKLNLRYNNLKDLPDFLGQMSQLTWLDLSGNPFQSIRIDLSQLYQLEHLELKWEKRSSAKKTELW